MGFVAPLLFGLLLLLSLRQSRQPLAGRTWQLLRSLLPSWRFFEDVAPGPELSFRVVVDGEQTGPWRSAIAPAPPRAFFLNAQGNLRLAQQSLVEQLWSELDGVTVDAATELVSYRLVQRLVVERMRELGLAAPRACYRFRLAISDSPADVGFESDEHCT